MPEGKIGVPEEPISLEGDDLKPEPLAGDHPSLIRGPSQMKAFGSKMAMAERKTTFNRQLNVNGTGATRFRMFHAKIAAAALEHMETQINTWLDGENIEVKQVGHVVGILEGKTQEPNLFVMVWY